MILIVALLLSGFVVLIKGADFLVNGASSIAKQFNVSNLVIGLTIVAFGTSMPELIVNIISSLNGQPDASFGNVIGSNNFNLLFILGVAGAICPLVVQKSSVKVEIPLSLLAAVILFVLANDVLIFGGDSNVLSRIDSLILSGCFIAFMIYIYRSTKTNPTTDDQPVKRYATPVAIGLIALGLLMLIGGGKLVVDNAIEIAHHFELSEKLIGLTILAVGTSLPELATSAVAAYKKNTDIAVGNVVGSNIFNIFFILGITGFIKPIPFNADLNFDLAVLTAGSIVFLIFMFTLRKHRLDRLEAILMFLGWIAYTAALITMD